MNLAILSVSRNYTMNYVLIKSNATLLHLNNVTRLPWLQAGILNEQQAGFTLPTTQNT